MTGILQILARFVMITGIGPIGQMALTVICLVMVYVKMGTALTKDPKVKEDKYQSNQLIGTRRTRKRIRFGLEDKTHAEDIPHCLLECNVALEGWIGIDIGVNL